MKKKAKKTKYVLVFTKEDAETVGEYCRSMGIPYAESGDVNEYQSTNRVRLTFENAEDRATAGKYLLRFYSLADVEEAVRKVADWAVTSETMKDGQREAVS